MPLHSSRVKPQVQPEGGTRADPGKPGRRGVAAQRPGGQLKGAAIELSRLGRRPPAREQWPELAVPVIPDHQPRGSAGTEQPLVPVDSQVVWPDRADVEMQRAQRLGRVNKQACADPVGGLPQSREVGAGIHPAPRPR